MFVDILGRIQQWTDLVQNKLDNCKLDLEALRKELMARACEIEDLRNQLAKCEEREKAAAATQTHVEKREVESQKVVAVEKEDDSKKEDESKKYDDAIVSAVPETRTIEYGQSPEVETKVVEIVCTDAAIQSMMKDNDRMRREIEVL
ncbi:uncharacterized protein LOC128887980 [Hylaeus anthracinus]|uniref:uncharacterized protein LOC128873111 n=1 Tax=Hylaeus volcanicus TaxID=313075 RepID=UPI0023B86D0C|nr:uncharacterized protein LOC128873111 [Hylaeus volcanicus]XP_054000502.1 uncharacterized protein LOC128887980 [Hylaeus anthracinus]